MSTDHTTRPGPQSSAERRIGCYDAAKKTSLARLVAGEVDGGK